jgi:hypothetical protein
VFERFLFQQKVRNYLESFLFFHFFLLFPRWSEECFTQELRRERQKLSLKKRQFLRQGYHPEMLSKMESSTNAAASSSLSSSSQKKGSTGDRRSVAHQRFQVVRVCLFDCFFVS